jgi:hypothetical protein
MMKRDTKRIMEDTEDRMISDRRPGGCSGETMGAERSRESRGGKGRGARALYIGQPVLTLDHHKKHVKLGLPKRRSPSSISFYCAFSPRLIGRAGLSSYL